MNKALFLDRDGVINIEKEYLYKIEDCEFLDGVFDTCKFFQEKGYLIIIITNQAGIARRRYSENDFLALSKWMIEEFKKHDVVISKIYFCPHHPDFTGKCECRKPAPGMIKRACKDFDIDPSMSILVGDKVTDIEAGINANISRLFLINTGHTIEENKLNLPVLHHLSELKNYK